MSLSPLLLPLLLLLLLFSLLQTPTFALTKASNPFYYSFDSWFLTTNTISGFLLSYVVYLGGHNHGLNPTSAQLHAVKNSHYELLGSFVGSTETAKEKIFYSYTQHINGFAAILDEEEASQIAKHPNVVSVFLNKGRKLHTTRSWDFLRLERDGIVPPDSLWKKARFGEDTIIGNLDTGVWPESKSFSDDGLGPIPSRWRGSCQHGADDHFHCNRKLIGAKFFNKGYSVFAGGKLNATFNTGGSPKARVAAYKVCWPPVNGPTPGTVSNLSPWMFTVGASTLDREFTSYVELGNNMHLKGASLAAATLKSKNLYPLITAEQAKAADASATDAILCQSGTLDPKKVKGNILVCLRGENARTDKGRQALLAGAVGMILVNDEKTGNEIIADPHLLPATHLNFTDGLKVFAYVNSTKNPTAYITPVKTKLDAKPAPFMASFSSRGPNTIDPAILKPDITAPGVSIIAAFSEAVGPTEDESDKLAELNGAATIRRKVKNVGKPGTYRAHVKSPSGVTVTVKPSKLTFKKIGQELKYEVTFKTKREAGAGAVVEEGGYAFGVLTWSDGYHYVRSPLVVKQM
ncbi:hypothetical protein V6N11_052118 [Hibiscus sabdariffa]|uniref:Uncharacterized protein n=1 Tax=Hibiscus sabdariffa TaxID=183260 RepID=A0ABR2U9L5_9ROSI